MKVELAILSSLSLTVLMVSGRKATLNSADLLSLLLNSVSRAGRGGTLPLLPYISQTGCLSSSAPYLTV